MNSTLYLNNYERTNSKSQRNFKWRDRLSKMFPEKSPKVSALEKNEQKLDYVYYQHHFTTFDQTTTVTAILTKMTWWVVDLLGNQKSYNLWRESTRNWCWATWKLFQYVCYQAKFTVLNLNLFQSTCFLYFFFPKRCCITWHVFVGQTQLRKNW